MKLSISTAVLFLSAILGGLAYADSIEPAASEIPITVYKSPSCGCCKLWIKHLQDNGFNVLAVDSDDMTTVKDEFGVPRTLRSCHTARVGDYTIEGHVPAKDILELLKSGSDADGLSVPGMPVGSPGMEVGDRVDAYDVVQFDGEETVVVASYGEAQEPADASDAEHEH